jgi:hypothetical protein
MKFGFASILAAGVMAVVLPSAQSAPRPLLPDLGVAPLQHMLIEKTLLGRKRLRFTTSVANVGQGPVGIVAVRLKLGSPFLVWQEIQRADGSSYRIAIPAAEMVYVGSEEHGHWHLRGAARYELRRLPDLRQVRRRVKRGFCLYDSSAYRLRLAGAAPQALYGRDRCGPKHALVLDTGLSVGWKDDYYWRIPGQQMDITTLPNGRYRLYAKADPLNRVRESDERNNVTWVDIHIGDQIVRVLGRSQRV